MAATSLAASTAAPAAEGRVRLQRTRTVAMRLVYGLLSLWALMMSTGVLQLAGGQLPAGPWHFAAAGSTAFKLLALTIPAVVLAVTAGRSTAAVRLLVAGQLALVLTAAVAPETSGEVFTALVDSLIWVGPWFLLSPNRRAVLRAPAAMDRVAVPLLGLALVPLGWWAVATGTAAAPRLPETGEGLEVRYDATGVAIALGVMAIAAAVVAVGTRWPARVVGAVAAVVGALAMVWPHDFASAGFVGGLCLVAGGLMLFARAARTSPEQR